MGAISPVPFANEKLLKKDWTKYNYSYNTRA
jgi:hypothetical protein